VSSGFPGDGNHFRVALESLEREADHPRGVKVVKPTQPGLYPQPWVGVQYVAVPEEVSATT
jgi:hypothetical protein